MKKNNLFLSLIFFCLFLSFSLQAQESAPFSLVSYFPLSPEMAVSFKEDPMVSNPAEQTKLKESIEKEVSFLKDLYCQAKDRSNECGFLTRFPSIPNRPYLEDGKVLAFGPISAPPPGRTATEPLPYLLFLARVQHRVPADLGIGFIHPRNSQEREQIQAFLSKMSQKELDSNNPVFQSVIKHLQTYPPKLVPSRFFPQGPVLDNSLLIRQISTDGKSHRTLLVKGSSQKLFVLFYSFDTPVLESKSKLQAFFSEIPWM